MPETSLPTSLPQEFHRFFWDVDAATLDPSLHPLYVINRLLDKGDVAAVRWVRRSFPEELIIKTIKTRRDFSPWNAVFWARFYGIPREEVRCLEPSLLQMRKQLWPY
jgi:hypothetical protein